MRGLGVVLPAMMMGGLTNEARIVILLIIDIVFFFVEIISGYAVGSLALVADSFHMLNDIMSLIVALYAVRLVNKGGEHPSYSYGWQRAEILGALFNGVFLLALCFSIFMEAIERFVSRPKVSNPKLVIMVGSLGLFSNIVGLFLFHGHSHGHGHSHDHEHSHDIEEGHSYEHSHEHDHERGHDEDDENDEDKSVGEIVGHPARARAFIMNKAHSLGYDPSKASGEQQRLLSPDTPTTSSYGTASQSHAQQKKRRMSHAEVETQEQVRRHRLSMGSTGHSHGNMNMTGVFLHVLGDAIGNFGVICTGMVILFTTYWWRYYADPLISFIIACIIFQSALPLVKSASFILLQGVPTSVSLEGVRDAVLRVDGVLGVHELHVWQLNENKIVASLHILVDCSAEQSTMYMHIAEQVRHSLHIWGIHSSTIQPEFVAGGLKEAARLSGIPVQDGSDESGHLLTPEGNLVKEEVAESKSACLLSCNMDECGSATCCPPSPQKSLKK